MHVDHIDPPALVRHIHSSVGNRWFLCSEIEHPKYRRYLLTLCDPRNGRGKDYFRIKQDDARKPRLYQLKGNVIVKFVAEESNPDLSSGTAWLQ